MQAKSGTFARFGSEHADEIDQSFETLMIAFFNADVEIDKFNSMKITYI